MKKLIISVNTSRFFLNHRLLLAKGAQKNGYHVVVLCPKDLEVDKIASQGFEVETIPLSRKGINPISEIYTFFRYYQAIRKHRPNVYHGFTIKPVLYGSICARLLKVQRVVVTITGLGYIFLNQSVRGKILRSLMGILYRLALRSSSVKVIFQNEDDKRLFIKKRWIYKNQALVVLGTGVDVHRFQPSKVALRLVQNESVGGDIKEAPIQIVFPARFLKDKGLFELVEASKEIYKIKKNFEIFLCGDLDEGNPSSLSQEELEEILKLPFIKFKGFQKDMSRVYKNAHVACLPSYREGIPLALIEAAASGLPIVATDVPGCRETVKNNKNGFLVPVKEVRGLKEALLKLINSKELRKKMGEESRKMALELFESGHVVSKNLEVYKAS